MLAYLHVACVTHGPSAIVKPHLYIPVVAVRVADRWDSGLIRFVEVRVPGVEGATLVPPEALCENADGVPLDCEREFAAESDKSEDESEEARACKMTGLHMVSVDDDGYCKICGQQF